MPTRGFRRASPRPAARPGRLRPPAPSARRSSRRAASPPAPRQPQPPAPSAGAAVSPRRRGSRCPPARGRSAACQQRPRPARSIASSNFLRLLREPAEDGHDRGLNVVSSGSSSWRMRLRVNRGSALDASSRNGWPSAREVVEHLGPGDGEQGADESHFGRSGRRSAIPRSPRSPVPRISRCRTVSAWSSAVCPVATQLRPDLGGDLPRASRTAPAGPSLPGCRPPRRPPRRRRAGSGTRRRAAAGAVGDERLVRVGLGAAQPVVQVGDRQRAGPDLGQCPQQGDAVRPAGHRDDARPPAGRLTGHEPPYHVRPPAACPSPRPRYNSPCTAARPAASPRYTAGRAPGGFVA